MASNTWAPAAKVSVSRMVAFQYPLVPMVPPVTVNPEGKPSIENSTLALGRVTPSRCSKPDPLSESTCPLTLNAVPATGLAVMLSTTRTVSERTVMLVRLALVARRSVDPL